MKYWLVFKDFHDWRILLGFHNRLNFHIVKYHPNIWTFIRCIQGEENRFNHVLIQMMGGLAAGTKTTSINLIQQPIDILMSMLLQWWYYYRWALNWIILCYCEKYYIEKEKNYSHLLLKHFVNLFIMSITLWIIMLNFLYWFIHVLRISLKGEPSYRKTVFRLEKFDRLVLPSRHLYQILDKYKYTK
jgi:hypothetical protein